MRLVLSILAVLLFTDAAALAQGPVDAAAPNLEGLWYAKKRLAPEISGSLTLDRRDGVWRASIADRQGQARLAGDTVSFMIPAVGRFRGRLSSTRQSLVGIWTQESPNVATPMTLTTCGTECYRGTVEGLADELTFFLKVARRPDGTLGAFLRNPERNYGTIGTRVARVELAGSSVRLLDRRDTLVLQGTLRNGIMSVFIPLRGGATYDFRRIADTAVTAFYPGGRPSATYTYTMPRQRGDGWEVANPRDVGIVPDSVNAIMSRIYAIAGDSVNSFQPHALLIARHGKLVVEEYFHGEYADKPHNTRSGSKSMLTTLIGAAMQKGVRITPQTRVYPTLRPGATNLDPRKQAMTLEDLLTMSAGLDCNDSGEERPGNEDVLTQNEAQPDWYSAILDLDVVRDAGVPAIYCSIKPHLAGAVLARVAGRPLDDMMRELLLEPLGMTSYYLGLSPLGDVYFGGGHFIRARDYLKLGQLYLNGGTWAGQRILGQDWVRRAIEPRFTIGRADYLNYGYLWWSREYPYRGGRVRAYMALGNGGQNVVFIPDLDLVIATNGGNYSDNPRVFYYTDEFIPRQILTAVLPSKE